VRAAFNQRVGAIAAILAATALGLQIQHAAVPEIMTGQSRRPVGCLQSGAAATRLPGVGDDRLPATINQARNFRDPPAVRQGRDQGGKTFFAFTSDAIVGVRQLQQPFRKEGESAAAENDRTWTCLVNGPRNFLQSIEAGFPFPDEHIVNVADGYADEMRPVIRQHRGQRFGVGMTIHPAGVVTGAAQGRVQVRETEREDRLRSRVAVGADEQYPAGHRNIFILPD